MGYWYVLLIFGAPIVGALGAIASSYIRYKFIDNKRHWKKDIKPIIIITIIGAVLMLGIVLFGIAFD